MFSPILLVFGPTASGKTALATKLAERVSGEVINADSMQLYEGLPILTALPSLEERRGVPHHLFGQVKADDRWSVGTWVAEAVRLINEIRKRGNTPILVGGTGLYFEALTKGLANIPDISDEVLAEVSKIADQQGLSYLREQLQRVDTVAAERILGADRQRLIRAFSVFLETGKPITHFHKETVPVIRQDEWSGLVLRPQRDYLYERIEQRFEHMVQQGVVDEVRNFLEQWGDSVTALHKAIGLDPLAKYIAGELSVEQAISLAQRDSRRYAKRQITWSRGRTGKWPAFEHLVDALSFFEANTQVIFK